MLKNIFSKYLYIFSSHNKANNNIGTEESLKITDTVSGSNDTTKFIQPMFPNGHFYSTIPDIQDLIKKEHILFQPHKKLPGIKLNDSAQVRLFNKLSFFYKDLDFTDEKTKKNRFYYQNTNFSYGDAVILYSMIRHLKPKNIIEIGSGFSSCVTLDTNEKYFNNKISCSFIEPYGDLLKSLLKTSDKIKLTETNLQDVPLKYFKTLKKNDILFIDSTHVSKTGSDVNYILFEILPYLNRGVIIHFHDVFPAFEYPKEWLKLGIFWNEDYILRAFLEYNSAFSILYFNSYMFLYHQKLLMQKMPIILNNPGAGLWIKKL